MSLPVALVPDLVASRAIGSVPLLVAAGSVALVVVLLLPLRVRPARPAPGAGPARIDRAVRWSVLGALIFAVLVLQGRGLVLALILTTTSAFAWRLVRRRRQDREAEARAVRVLEYCDSLAGDLAVGTPPRTALEHSVGDFEEFVPVASAAWLGSDVASAMRDLAVRPGFGDLRLVAAAWQVAERSGGGLAAALARVADGVRERRRTSRLVAAELASAWATARIMAGLPLFFVVAGSGIGADPLGFLTGTTAGLACLAVGCALSLTGLFWLQRVAAAVQAA